MTALMKVFEAIRLDPKDNVATALRALPRGARPNVSGLDGDAPSLDADIGRGHKFALSPIAAGQTIYKYGSPIGRATGDIAVGSHVHLHNLEGFAGAAARASGEGASA